MTKGPHGNTIKKAMIKFKEARKKLRPALNRTIIKVFERRLTNG